MMKRGTWREGHGQHMKINSFMITSCLMASANGEVYPLKLVRILSYLLNPHLYISEETLLKGNYNELVCVIGCMLINIVQYFRCYCAVSIYMFSLPYVCVWTGAYIMYSGLSRCGKSCRLRWLNYLRPDIKRGNITEQEEDLIIRLHNLLGNRYHFWFSFFILLSNYENKIWYQQYNATFIKLTDQSYI